MKPNRIFIFGATGSGKTTLAKKLSKKTHTRLYTTDDFIYKKNSWNEKYSEKIRDKKLKETARKKNWIIEGVHRGEWIYPAFKKSDFVIILDVPRHKLFKRVIIREIKRKMNQEVRKSKPKDFWLLLKYAYLYKKENFLYHKELVKKYKKEYVIVTSSAP